MARSVDTWPSVVEHHSDRSTAHGRHSRRRPPLFSVHIQLCGSLLVRVVFVAKRSVPDVAAVRLAKIVCVVPMQRRRADDMEKMRAPWMIQNTIGASF